jgi:hypothetical protein
MTETVVEDEDQTVNLELIARDQIERWISSIFTGHAFTNLIAAILAAQGYETHVSPLGPNSALTLWQAAVCSASSRLASWCRVNQVTSTLTSPPSRG